MIFLCAKVELNKYRLGATNFFTKGVNDMETLKKGFQEANAKQMVDDMFKHKNEEEKSKLS